MTSSLAFLHILKTWISLEQKEIFEKSKQNFSSHAGYLLMFYNGFDRKDAIFVIVAFENVGNVGSIGVIYATDSLLQHID